MVKYQLKHARTDEPIAVYVDESAINDFCELMIWTHQDFYFATIKIEDNCD